MASIAQPQQSIVMPGGKHGSYKERTTAQTITPGVSLVAGAFGGAMEATITYPFEFAKTRAQLSRAASSTSAPISRNPFAVIAQTARHDGIRAIYTGCSTLILGTACKAGVRFVSFDAIKNVLSDEDGKLSPSRAIFAGMVAGAVESVTVVAPTERLKTALIDDARSVTKRFNGGLHALRTIVFERGFGELYRGLLPTTIKQSATSAVRMGSYNVIKETVSSKTEVSIKNPVVTFGMGAAAGVVTVYVTQPFDTVKTRSQGAKGASTTSAIREIWRTGGLRSFWSGSSMRLGRLVLSGGIVFMAYENVAMFLMGVKK